VYRVVLIPGSAILACREGSKRWFFIGIDYHTEATACSFNDEQWQVTWQISEHGNLVKWGASCFCRCYRYIRLPLSSLLKMASAISARTRIGQDSREKSQGGGVPSCVVSLFSGIPKFLCY
jgi:hypothetical protein